MPLFDIIVIKSKRNLSNHLNDNIFTNNMKIYTYLNKGIFSYIL